MSRCDHGVGVDSDDQLGCSTCDDLRQLELAEDEARTAEHKAARKPMAWRLGDLLERLGRRMKEDRP